MNREEIFSHHKKLILKAITKQTIYPFEVIEHVFDKVKSFDKTIVVLNESIEMNLHPDHIIHLFGG